MKFGRCYSQKMSMCIDGEFISVQICALTGNFWLKEVLLPLSQNWRFAGSHALGRHGVVEALSYVH